MPRRHFIDGVETLCIHDARTQRMVRLEPRYWDLIACADGTRDFDALVLASARAGAYRRASELRALFDQLADAGLLEDGIDAPLPPHQRPPETPDDRPLLALPGYTLSCDRNGSCCAQYGSIRFGELEANRARALVPGVLRSSHAPDGLDRVFLPLYGSMSTRELAVALVDGRCAYLDDEGSCRIHSASGAEAKPVTCQLHPATFVDDGTSVRVSIGVECRCVLSSVGVRDGAPLVPPSMSTRGALDRRVTVRALPLSVPITPSRTMSRQAIARWSTEAIDAIDEGDVALRFLALARSLEIDAAPSEPPVLSSLQRFFEPLRRSTEDAARSAESWRSSRDRARIARRAVADAAARLAREGPVHPPHPQDEAFYLRATLFGHHAVADGLPLCDALRDRALRVLVARALEGHVRPLALVEATLRGAQPLPSG